ncbi:MAG: adenylosuccinate synthetase [Thaumarchaeota archaeon]|nr:adenylosuccinate synthetase [Nitrososphaerota archaeon]
MSVLVIVGGFFGDEGKGKIVSYLALKDKPDAVIRGGVGPNAGHTVVHNGIPLKLRLLPSAVVSPETKLMIGAGVSINTDVLLSEIKEFSVESRVLIDRNCLIITDEHIRRDASDHLKGTVGTTGTGTGPANADRALRLAKLAGDEASLSDYIGSVSSEAHTIIKQGGTIHAEGSQGTFLSLYHGNYPYVTSKDVTASAICSDIGIGPCHVQDVLVVLKSYVTRVGSGDLPGELNEQEIQSRGWSESGTVTGRSRRAAPFDFELARKAIALNSATMLAVTKLDTLYPAAGGVREFNKLPEDARRFVNDLEKELDLQISLIGTGPDTMDIIDRREP